MSALPSALQAALQARLEGQLAALDAQLATPPLPVLPPFTHEEPPPDPTVTISLPTAQEVLIALRERVRVLEAAAEATHGPTSEDVASVYFRAARARKALDELVPAERAACEENRRRRDEWRAENARRRAGQRSS